jgi:ABC-type lipoprotein release transport system permease subunit
VLQGKQYTSEATLRAAIYVPYEQSGDRHRDRHFVVRTGTDPRLLLPAIRRAVARVDPALPLYKVRTFDEIRAALLADRRFAMIALLGFGLLASGLAALGLYSVLAHLVQQRTREIGIRLAIGATPESVRRLVLSNGLGHATAGLALGAACTFASWRIVAAKVPKVGQVDAATIALLGVGILLVAAIATWVPARRATRIDPMEALRCE